MSFGQASGGEEGGVFKNIHVVALVVSSNFFGVYSVLKGGASIEIITQSRRFRGARGFQCDGEGGVFRRVAIWQIGGLALRLRFAHFEGC